MELAGTNLAFMGPNRTLVNQCRDNKRIWGLGFRVRTWENLCALSHIIYRPYDFRAL